MIASAEHAPAHVQIWHDGLGWCVLTSLGDRMMGLFGAAERDGAEREMRGMLRRLRADADTYWRD